MHSEVLTLTASDGYALNARLLLPDSPPTRTLAMNPALGVPKEFYRRFCERATELGYAALLYDYRGIGGSRRGSLRGFNATFRDYGILDIAAAIEFLTSRFPDLPLHAVGHSAGGQLLGLAHNCKRISRATLIACSTGTLSLLPRPFRYLARFMMQASSRSRQRCLATRPRRASDGAKTCRATSRANGLPGATRIATSRVFSARRFQRTGMTTFAFRFAPSR
ncbi:MAG: alpha/beta fold hydrolase [Thermoanaerobaculia bacterium]